MAALTPVLIGVMRMPLSPRATESSIAVIWPASSPSALPDATVRLTLFLSASAFAPFCMATKKGFVESFVMRATPTLSPDPAVPPPPEAGPESDPHAAAPSRTEQLATATRARRPRRRWNVGGDVRCMDVTSLSYVIVRQRCHVDL